jgi:serine protease
VSISSSTAHPHRPGRPGLTRLAAGLGAMALSAVLGVATTSAASANTSGTASPHPLKARTSHTAPAAGSNLINHGGPVQTAPKVYVVYWGWTSDPSGEQSYLNNFLSSVGGTQWLSTVNQYGSGSNSTLSGTWSDSASVPSHPSDSAIQAEAAKAASHFGAGTSVNVQIVVATPTGHSTSGFGTQWCAYHGAVSSDRNVTYTDLPYMTDAGSSCGAYSVRSALDGVSIVEGHELAEAITDPLLNAWYDSSGSEIGDKCAWQNLSTISTSKGTFAVQPLWSNAAGGCVL